MNVPEVGFSISEYKSDVSTSELVDLMGRNSDGFVYVFKVQLSNVTHKIVVRPNRKWKMPSFKP